MKNAALRELNFQKLLHYGGQPPVQNRYQHPLPCRGYCVDCENSGTLKATGGSLDLMSHGCDSSDFAAILGPMKRSGRALAKPVLFLLQNPGSDSRYRNGNVVPFRSFTKKPPVNHYYWTPSGDAWPTRIRDIIKDHDHYGRYFAYLMQHHQLINVYITNLVKCRWRQRPDAAAGRGDASKVTHHCAERHLKRELAIFKPRVAFCFGGAVAHAFKEYAPDDCRVTTLFHPAYIKNRSQTDPHGRSKEQLFAANDKRIEDALALGV